MRNGGTHPLRIGVFTDSYRPYTSGVVRSIETFRAELEARDALFYIFAPWYKGCKPESRIYRFVSFPVPTNPGFRLALPFSLKIGSTIKELKLDLVHVHSPFLLGGLGARWARRLDLPLVFTYHTLYEEYVHYFPFLKTQTRQLTLRYTTAFCNRCDLVLAPTRVIGSYLLETGVRARIRTLPTGIDLKSFQGGDRDGFRKRYGIGPDERVMVYVGRLAKEKNIGFLLKTLGLIVDRLPGTRLLLVGGGPQREDLVKEAEEKNVGRNVVFTGPVAPDYVKDCYAAGDVFVISSLTETQGLVVGEAKAAGLPAVAVRAKGLTEMVDEGVDGFLVPLDEKVFAERVCRLFEDRELYGRFRVNALQKAEELSAPRAADTLLNYYQEAIKSKGVF
ncbi:MAG: glycosyltransferase family 4 protein [Bacillota bacterium]